MANSITLVSKYLPLLDEKFAIESRSAILDTTGDLIQSTADAKTVLIAKMALQGLANYSRDNGFADGTVTLEWESHQFRYDRGRSFNIDAMDNDESLGILFANVAGQFIRTQVAPEVDAIRFAEYATNAGLSKAETLTADTVVDALDDGIVAMEEKEAPAETAIAFMTPTVYAAVKKSGKFTRPLTPSENPNRNYGSFDDHMVVKVPQTRFYTAIDLTADGAGGYAKKSTASDINFMWVCPQSVVQITKHVAPRVFSPEVNQKADAYKIDYRIYHDAWVLENGKNGIYVSTNNAAG